MSREAHEQNRRSWNAATRAHNRHKRDQAGFLRGGGTTLFAEELELLGDLAGRKLVHLQCNAGQDTLCLARLAGETTGVDISDEAVDFARSLSRDSGIAARFERADLYDWLEREARDGGRRFDVAFSSYGAVPWLSELAAWARGLAAVLAPGGRFVLVEFHPFAMMFDERWRLAWPYFPPAEPVRHESGVADYVAWSGETLAPSGFEAGASGFVNPEPCVEYFWGVSRVIQALVDAGLRLERFVEYPHANGFRSGERMRELPGRRYATPEGMPDLPLMYGLVARRPR